MTHPDLATHNDVAFEVTKPLQLNAPFNSAMLKAIWGSVCGKLLKSPRMTCASCVKDDEIFSLLSDCLPRSGPVCYS